MAGSVRETAADSTSTSAGRGSRQPPFQVYAPAGGGARDRHFVTLSRLVRIRDRLAGDCSRGHLADPRASLIGTDHCPSWVAPSEPMLNKTQRRRLEVRFGRLAAESERLLARIEAERGGGPEREGRLVEIQAQISELMEVLQVVAGRLGISLERSGPDLMRDVGVWAALLPSDPVQRGRSPRSRPRRAAGSLGGRGHRATGGDPPARIRRIEGGLKDRRGAEVEIRLAIQGLWRSREPGRTLAACHLRPLILPPTLLPSSQKDSPHEHDTARVLPLVGTRAT
jgi:hypothetical protein